MSYAPAQLHGCPDLQLELDSQFETCDASILPDPAPLNTFLWSSLNRSGFQQTLVPGQGKTRTVQLRYDQRLLETQVTTVDGCTTNCTATTKRGDLITSYEIDTCDTLEVSELMNAEDFVLACRDNGAIVTKKVRLLINAMVAKIATKMTGLAIAKHGAWQANVNNMGWTGDDNTGNSAKALLLQTFKTGSTTDLNPIAYYKLNNAINKTNYCRGGVLFGASDLEMYYNLMKAGCCASNGTDLGEILRQFGIAVVWDRRYENAMGHEYGTVIMPGALQPIYYNHATQSISDALNNSTGRNYAKGIITDPATNIPMDLTISDNCGNVSIILRATVDLKAMPTDMFAPSDNMEGVTFVNKVKVV